MPPDPCRLCGGKWLDAGGGLCSVCRTLDRLSAVARGPAVPPEAEAVVLQRLRTWVGDLQDVGEPPVEEVISAAKLTLQQCRELDEIEVIKGSYWEAEIKAVLKVQEAIIKQGEIYLKAQVMGTQNEALLRAATTRPDRMIEAHLCPEGCTGGPHIEGVVHVAAFKKLGPEREPWMTNMLPEDRGGAVVPRGADELEDLRADMRRLKAPLERGGRDEGAEEVPETESEDKKKKKRRRSRSRRKKKKEWKVEGQKEVKALYAWTGMDPDPIVRRRFRRRAARLARKRGRDSKGSSSSSSSDTEEVPGGDHTLFGSSSKVQVIGRQLPGALAAAAVEEISESLITEEGGLWQTQTGVLPPLFVRYYKQQLGGKMAAPMGREALTMCHAIDLLMRGRAAEATDLLAQRVKALELQASGVHYTVSQQQELLSREASSISTTTELWEAAKRAREEGRVRADAARPYGTKAGTPSKAEETSKGWGKKGTGKGKGNRGDPKKAEGDKGDKGKPKGS
eukprot:s66_g15.t1